MVPPPAVGNVQWVVFVLLAALLPRARAARLEYDNSAALFFFISLVSCLLTPFTIWFLQSLWAAVRGSSSAKARTLAEKGKTDKLHAENSLGRRLFTTGHLTQLLVLGLGWVLVVVLSSQVSETTEIASFNPFKILEIDEGVEEMRTIKKAYRKLSLVYHPDKWEGKSNVDRELAGQKFMMIAKAYEALTDEEARKNWIEFGNPDGRQALQVSIGLPTALLDPANQNLVLVIYLVGLVVAIPLAVGLWYSKSKLYADKGVLIETFQFFAFLLDQNILTKHLLEVVSLAAEFHKLPMRPEDREVLAKLERAMKQDDGMVKKPLHKIHTKHFFERFPASWKANVLLHAHCNRMTEGLSEELLQDLQERILPQVPILIEAMLEITTQRRYFRACLNILDLSQYVTQSIWVGQSELLQLPHFTEHEVRHSASGKGGIKTIAQFMSAPAQERLGMRKKGMTKFSEQQCEDVESMVQVLPRVSLEANIGVLSNNPDVESDEATWEEMVGPQDVCTCRFELKRVGAHQHEAAEEAAGAAAAKKAGGGEEEEEEEAGEATVHAPYLPFERDEGWMAILTIPNEKTSTEMIIGMTKISDSSGAEKIMFQPPQQPGTYKFTLHLKSDCYLGFDQKQTLTLKVFKADEIVMPTHHPEDEELDNEPTFMQQLAGELNQEYEEDSDFESDSDGEEGVADGLTEEQRKKRAARQARKKDTAGKKDTDAEGDGTEKGADLDAPLESDDDDDDDDDFEMVE